MLSDYQGRSFGLNSGVLIKPQETAQPLINTATLHGGYALEASLA